MYSTAAQRCLLDTHQNAPVSRMYAVERGVKSDELAELEQQRDELNQQPQPYATCHMYPSLPPDQVTIVSCLCAAAAWRGA